MRINIIKLIFIASIFSMNLIHARDYNAKEPDQLDQIIDKAISCFPNQDCINRNIISDTDNLTDLYKAIEAFNKDVITSKTNIHIYYWDYVQLKSSSEYNEIDFLTQQFEILKNLSDCLVTSSQYPYTDTSSLISESIDLLISNRANFYFGDQQQIIKTLIKKNFYACTLKPENIKRDFLSLKDDCLKQATEDYFNNQLQIQLKDYQKVYGKKFVQKHKKEFNKCRGNKNTSVQKAWICYSTLSASLLEEKLKFMEQKLVKLYPKSKVDIDNYANCLNVGSKIEVCKRLSIEASINAVLASSKQTIPDDIKEGIITRCSNNSSYKSEINCIQDIKLALKSPNMDDLKLKLYYKNLEDTQDSWDNPTVQEAKTNLLSNQLIDAGASYNIKLQNEALQNQGGGVGGQGQGQWPTQSLELNSEGPQLVEEDEISSLNENQQNPYQPPQNWITQLISDDTLDFLKNTPGLTSAEVACINAYTSNMWYPKLNKNLWYSGTLHKDTSDVTHVNSCITSGLKKIAKSYENNNTYYKEYVYRGMGDAPFTDRFSNQDDCIVFTGFTSTSSEKEGAFYGKFSIKIKNCPASSQDAGAYIDPISQYHGEKEVLFPPGTRFKVTQPTAGSYSPYEVELECITQEQYEKEKLDCH